MIEKRNNKLRVVYFEEKKDEYGKSVKVRRVYTELRGKEEDKTLIGLKVETIDEMLKDGAIKDSGYIETFGGTFVHVKWKDGYEHLCPIDTLKLMGISGGE